MCIWTYVFNNRKLFMVIPMCNENVQDWLKMLFTKLPESGHIYLCMDMKYGHTTANKVIGKKCT